MSVDDKQKRYIKGRYLEYLERLKVENRKVDFYAYDEEMILPLADQIRKDTKIRQHMGRFEVLWWLHTRPPIFHDASAVKADGLFKDVHGQAALEEIAQGVVDFFEGLPYEYFFYLKLPFPLQAGVREIALTEDTSVIRMDEMERENIILKDKPDIADLFTNPNFLQVDSDAAYFKVKVNGYGNEAEARALMLFKRFLYLCEASGFITSLTWERTGEQGYNSMLSLCPALNEKIPYTISIPSDVAYYVSGVKLNEKHFQDYMPPGEEVSLLTHPDNSYEEYYMRKFKWGCRTFARVHDKSAVSEPEHIYSAIEWGLDGASNRNETMGFVQTCIGLEALLGDKGGERQKSLTDKLADRCAYLLGKTPAERKVQANLFRKIYDLRSELVHGIKLKVSEEQDRTVSEAHSLLAKLIFNEIWLNK